MIENKLLPHTGHIEDNNVKYLLQELIKAVGDNEDEITSIIEELDMGWDESRRLKKIESDIEELKSMLSRISLHDK